MAEEAVVEEEVAEEETTEETEEVQDDTVSEEDTDESDEGDAETEDAEDTESTEEEVEEEEPDEEIELTIPYSNGQKMKVSKEKLIDIAERGLGADAKFQESNTQAQKLKQVMDELKTRPFEILQNLGVDTRKMAEDFLIQKMEEEALNEDQKRALAAERRVKELEAKQVEEDKAKEKKEMAGEVAKLKTQFEQEFISALDEEAIPNTPQTVARMARYMEDAQRYEGIEMTAKQAAGLVKQDIIEETRAIYGNISAEKIEEMLGSAVIKKVKQHDLSKIKSPQDKNKVEKAEAAPIRKKKRGGKTFKQIQEELNIAHGGDPWEYDPKLDS
jgi:hypothetical protein